MFEFCSTDDKVIGGLALLVLLIKKEKEEGTHG